MPRYYEISLSYILKYFIEAHYRQPGDYSKSIEYFIDKEKDTVIIKVKDE